eukprot:CAMPEP_0174252310 /NCGR_PEP_ID=MMETSP0439-20130205/1835_1 /TAXON_ID=0 /ORGANISM="Stereomyxa ramosa, Strain Chinc5" /LENGTH=531 /DNA_ID=CAMNT_0015332827 /DNA_START=73 /DNA_END=1668 /DNA_ORIENTATION=-
MSFAADEQRNYLKAGITSEDSRRKRGEHQVRIRKNKREEQMKKRRNIVALSPTPAGKGKKMDASLARKLQDMPKWLQMCHSGDPRAQLEGTTQIRKLLSIEQNPPIDEVIRSGILPTFVRFLSAFDNEKLQLESAWALTNVASGTSEQTMAVVNVHAVIPFVKLLNSHNADVREQAIWALGNIAGESTQCRDFILSQGVISLMAKTFQSNPTPSMLKNATWSLSNFCRGKPAPDFELVAPALPILKELINLDEKDVLADACWALSYLSDGENERIEAVVASGVVPRLVKLLGHKSYSVKTPALRSIGNIVTGEERETDAVVECMVMPHLLRLLKCEKKTIRKETCWTISNITAGTPYQIQQVIDAGIMPVLIEMLNTSDFDIKKEAGWAITNATSVGKDDQIDAIVNMGAIPPMCDLLGCTDARVITVALDGLENILKLGKKSQKCANYFISEKPTNKYADAIEEADGLDKLEALQTHANEEIYNQTIHILEKYFNAEEEDENLAPNVLDDGSAFSFAAPSGLSIPSFNFA